MQFGDFAPSAALAPRRREPLPGGGRQGEPEAELEPEGEGVAGAGAQQHHEAPAALGVVPLEEVRHLAATQYPLLVANHQNRTQTRTVSIAFLEHNFVHHKIP